MKQLDKWKHLINTNEKSIEQLIKLRKVELSKIPDPETYKGLEQIFIDGFDSIRKGLIKSNAIDGAKKVKFKSRVLKAKAYLQDKLIAEDLAELERRWGKTLDDLVAEMFKTRNIQ